LGASVTAALPIQGVGYFTPYSIDLRRYTSKAFVDPIKDQRKSLKSPE
jgi:hypothetical protein